jgi:hypothetical protein
VTAKYCAECANAVALGVRAVRPSAPAIGEILQFCPQCAQPTGAAASLQVGSPPDYTPEHLAKKILSLRTALEGERKQVTVLFADLKASMELLADRDPEEARRLLDRCLSA